VTLLADRRQIELRAGLVQAGDGGQKIILRLHDFPAVDLSSGAPRATLSPILANIRITRPENGVSTGRAGHPRYRRSDRPPIFSSRNGRVSTLTTLSCRNWSAVT